MGKEEMDLFKSGFCSFQNGLPSSGSIVQIFTATIWNLSILKSEI